ncbi:hypothetical protein [Actinocatenispora rupis]|uniref:hypothetical protein n=1 Tax=Actinocatenispora rupis TaxID=519421 RepID=UPI001944B383|nr:hypothetical protein [Actinocatenispora rupis]
MEPLEPRCLDCGSREVDVLHVRPSAALGTGTSAGAEIVCHDCGWIGWTDTDPTEPDRSD